MPTRCQLCGAANLKEVLNLGHQPICNALLTSREVLNRPETYYPLRLVVCTSCFLVQLANVVPQEIVFSSEFNHLSSTTGGLVDHFRNLSGDLVNRLSLSPDDTVCDLGSNDGTFLKLFKEKGARVLGVEPTAVAAEIASKSGVPTVTAFFDDDVAERVVKSHGFMRLVTAMNVLAHTDDPHSFLEGVTRLMARDSVFVCQNQYLGGLIDKLEYDTIYQEHLRYYSLTTLSKLLRLHGLHIFDFETTPVLGGSFIAYCSRFKSRPSPRVTRMLVRERKYKKWSIYERFGREVKQNRRKLVGLVLLLKARGKSIAGVGAPMKASTLLNYCRLGTEAIDYLTEINQLKIGKYSPGVHIPIVDEKRILDDQPDYALLLSWNLANAIIPKLRGQGYKGKFILPIPYPRVVAK